LSFIFLAEWSLRFGFFLPSLLKFHFNLSILL
jgi:hypothetical protein